METRNNLWRNPNILNATHQGSEYKESWVACTLGKSTLKRAFCTIILTLVRYLTSSWSIAFFLVWMSTVGTCWLAPVRSNWFAFLTQLLPLLLGVLSFSHTHHVPMRELANCLPCMGVLTTHRPEGLPFCIEDSRFVLFYSRRCCDLWVTQQYIQYNFSFCIKKRPTFVAANGHQ
jgi:hypothetical protein